MKTDGTWSYTWEHGRHLKKMVSDGTTAQFYYDADGNRVRKTVNGQDTEYYYQGDRLIEVKQGSTWLHYNYDSIGPASAKYVDTIYYFLRNAQGDVLGIVDSWGNEVVRYTYDAWGNILSTTGSMANTLGKLNVLRYRGYVYDEETGLYYLKTRYYNPSWGRFINADSPVVPTISPDSATWDKNLFAYCDNNPVMRKDDGGQCWHIIVGAFVGVASQYICDVATNLLEGKSFFESLKHRSTWADYTSAAISGALAATGIGLGASVVANAALGGTTYLTNCVINDEDPNALDLVLSTGIGALAGRVGGKGVNGKQLRGVVKYSKNMIKSGAAPAKAAMYAAKITTAYSKALNGARSTFTAGAVSYLANFGRRLLTGSEA